MMQISSIKIGRRICMWISREQFFPANVSSSSSFSSLVYDVLKGKIVFSHQFLNIRLRLTRLFHTLHQATIEAGLLQTFLVIFHSFPVNSCIVVTNVKMPKRIICAVSIVDLLSGSQTIGSAAKVA